MAKMKSRSVSSKGPFPELGQPVVVVEQAYSTAKTANDWYAPTSLHGFLFVMENDDDILRRFATAMPTGLVLYGARFEANVVLWQSYYGSVWSTSPDNPDLPAFMGKSTAINISEPKSEFVLHSSGLMEEVGSVCDRCEPKSQFVCKGYGGGYRHVTETMLNRKDQEQLNCELFQMGLTGMKKDLRQMIGGNVDQARKASPMSFIEFCSKNTRDLFVPPAMMKKALEKAGFWVTSRIELCDEEQGFSYGLNEADRFRIEYLIKQGVRAEKDTDKVKQLMSSVDLHLDRGDLATFGDHIKKRHVDEMVVRAGHIRAGAMAKWLAMRDSAKEASERATMRREFCKPCVYKCEKWTDACTVTEAEIIAEYPATDAARRWMALFNFTGERLKQGRRAVMVFGPRSIDVNAPLTFMTRGLSPPFKTGKDVESSELLGEDWVSKIELVADELKNKELRTQALLFWALQKLWGYCNPIDNSGGVIFRKNKLGRKDRSSYNEVFHIEIRGLYGNPEIVVTTDTHASCKGSAFGRKGESIKTDDRPRFKTSYSFPYAKDMYMWTGEPLGKNKKKAELYAIERRRRNEEKEKGHPTGGENPAQATAPGEGE